MTEHHPTSATTDRPSAGAFDALMRNRSLLLGLAAAVLVLATMIAYVPAVGGDFVWDDDHYVTDNRLLRTWTGLQRIWFDILPSPRDYPLPQYYPMTHTSFWIEYQLWGLNPVGYHVTNVLLHAGNALLIWLLLRKLAVPGAWIAAAIFAVHPMNVESVAWIAERKNVLSAFFFLTSLYVYLRYAGLVAPPENPSDYLTLPKEPERVWGLAFALFVFALASKTVTATLPAVVLLLMWWKRGRFARKDVVPLLPFIALGIGAALLTGWMEVHRVGARGPDWQHASTAIGDFAARFLIAGRAIWFYVGKLIFPYPLIFNYPRWQIDISSITQWMYPVSALAVLGALAAGVRWIGRGPLTAALYFVGTLFPALGFFNVFPHRYSFVADHFVYLSSIGLIALAVAVAVHLCIKYLPREAFASGAPTAAVAGVIAVYMLLTLVQSRIYRSPAKLWEDTLIKTDQRSWFAANNYGVLLLNRNRLRDAEAWFGKVLRLKPDHAEARYNLGLVAERRGEIDDAIAWHQESLEYRPGYPLPLFRLGQIMQARGELDAAENYFRSVIEHSSRDEIAHIALGVLLEQRGKYKEAIDFYQRAADLDPSWSTPYIQTGSLLVKMGHLEEAMRQFAEAGRLEPNNPRVANNAAALLASSGYLHEARVLLERALWLDPSMVEAHRQLGVVLAMMGDRDLGRQHLMEALRLDPDSERIKANLQALEEGRLIAPTTVPGTEPAAEPQSSKFRGDGL